MYISEQEGFHLSFETTNLKIQTSVYETLVVYPIKDRVSFGSYV